MASIPWALASQNARDSLYNPCFVRMSPRLTNPHSGTPTLRGANLGYIYLLSEPWGRGLALQSLQVGLPIASSVVCRPCGRGRLDCSVMSGTSSASESLSNSAEERED